MRKHSWGGDNLTIERIQNGYIIQWVEENYSNVGECAPLRHDGSTHVKTTIEDAPNEFKSPIQLLDFIIGYFNMDSASLSPTKSKQEKRICLSLIPADDTIQNWHGDPDILKNALKEEG